MTIRYEIMEHDVFDYALYSITEIKKTKMPGGLHWGGGTAKNYICAGSMDYCASIKKRLEGAQ